MFSTCYFIRSSFHRSTRPDWQAEALCSQPVISFARPSIVRSSVRPSVRPSIPPLPNLQTRYFENKWNDYDENWHNWSTGQGYERCSLTDTKWFHAKTGTLTLKTAPQSYQNMPFQDFKNSNIFWGRADPHQWRHTHSAPQSTCPRCSRYSWMASVRQQFPLRAATDET